MDTQVLAALRRAEGTLADDPYDFTNWKQCTAGHLYRATHGGQEAVRDTQVCYSDDPLYAETLGAVVKAQSSGRSGTASAVSDLTKRRACHAEGRGSGLGYNGSRRAAARGLVREAIDNIQAQEAADETAGVPA